MAMPPTILHAFLAAVPTMNATQRKQVEAALLASRKPVQETEDAATIVHHAVELELRARGVQCYRLPSWKRRRGFTDAAERLDAFVDALNPVNRGIRLSLHRAILRVLIRRRERAQLPITQIAMASELSYALDILKREFPGYDKRLLQTVLTMKDRNA